MLTLSVLDQVPHFRGKTAFETLQETLLLARTVERLGYQRFWIAEHHDMGHFACSSPEILAAVVAACTTSLRVGSGGVMMANYSPLKVAETFRLLQACYPGRIDLGIGRGSGANRLANMALQGSADKEQAGADSYIQQVQTLLSLLADQEIAGAGYPAYPEVRALPGGVQSPEVWILSTGQKSADAAAMLGLPLCFAQFLHASPLPHVLGHYRATFCPSPFLATPKASLAVRVLCAESEEEAARLALSFWLNTLRHVEPQRKLVSAPPWQQAPSLEDALSHVYTAQERVYIEQHALLSITGTPQQVKARLEALAACYQVDELILLTFCPDTQARLRSYTLLAEAFALSTRETYAPVL